MAGVWKRDGTVAVTNGNKKVTGTGTTFADTKNGVAKGHLFCITSGTSVDFYEVDYVVSNTELYLVQAYRGTTATGKAYEIITTFSDSVPEFARRLTATLSAYQQQSDAFQALLTSTATTVEVTAPDGTKQTLIPWKRVTSEGEGQAARAKTEADKAAASAALAGDIVAASALPLPDVWAPLSDSLRLITGYGRDVLVGSDVVARMVNFSRNSTATYIGKDGQLKTAAANEPRFEKEGLLIEGQSQNLVTHSVDLIAPSWNKQQSGTGSAPVVTANYAQAPDGSMTACRLQMNKGAGASTVDYSGVLHPISGLVVGATHTLSVWLKSANQNSYNIALSLNGLGSTNVAITPEWRRFTITVVLDDPNRYPRLQLRGGQGTSDTADILTWGWQQEALPFASSYIPTNGAAVTRAADICWIPSELNVTPEFGNITIAAEVRRNQAIPTSLYPRVIHISDRQFITADSRRVMVRGGGQEQAVVMVNATGLMDRIATTIRGQTLACYLNGAKNEMPQTPTFPVSGGGKCFIGGANGTYGLFGHVRNVRIWQRTLSDEQIKAAA
ncbi:LamG-like jellyroll fold domain-containing protein [Aeromonas caviae]